MSEDRDTTDTTDTLDGVDVLAWGNEDVDAVEFDHGEDAA